MSADQANIISRSILTQRFFDGMRKGVEGIIEACQAVVDGKKQLDHGEFTPWVVNELKLSTRAAQWMMNVARDEVLSNPNHWFAFPPSWRTLSELVPIPPKRKLKLIAEGKIHAGMTHEDAIALIPGRKQDKSQFILAADILRLLQKTEQFSDAEAVSELRADQGALTADMLHQFGHRLVKRAKQWKPQ